MSKTAERRKNGELTMAEQAWEFIQATEGEPFLADEVAEYLAVTKQTVKTGLAYLSVAGVLDKELVPGRGHYRYTLRED